MDRRFGAQNMVGRLRLVVVKRPAEAFGSVEKIEREWQRLGFTAPPDLKKAEEEFSQLEEILRQEGAEILYLPADERTTLDSIYTHDPVLITEAGAIILQMGKKERAGEPEAFEDALKSWCRHLAGFPVRPQPKAEICSGWMKKRSSPAAASGPIRKA